MQAVPPSFLSHLIAFSEDGICTYFVPFQSLISSKGPYLSDLILFPSHVDIYNTFISYRMPACKIKHKKQLAKAVREECSRVSFPHNNKFITLLLLTRRQLPAQCNLLLPSVPFDAAEPNPKQSFQLQKKDLGRPNFKSNLGP